MKTTRIAPGFYTVTVGDNTWNIIRWEHTSRWYYVNANNPNEGGEDIFDTKKEAIEALEDYLKHRAYVEGYGYCYVP